MDFVFRSGVWVVFLGVGFLAGGKGGGKQKRELYKYKLHNTFTAPQNTKRKERKRMKSRFEKGSKEVRKRERERERERKKRVRKYRSIHHSLIMKCTE